MKYFTIIFDFDGTLADSAPLAFSIINSLASEFGFASVSQEELPRLRALSTRELLIKRAGIPLWNILKIRRLERRIREEFANRGSELSLFAGIPELLRSLREKGYELGIVTSNSQDIVEDVLRRGGSMVDFVHAGSTFFGKSRALRAAFREYDVDRRHALYVGDELRDVAACKKAGIAMLAVGWGFNSVEALRGAHARVASTSEELLRMLSGV